MNTETTTTDREVTMFATLSAATVAARESFAADARIAAVYFEVAGTEYRFSRNGDVTAA